jgi:hypothetical protein
MRQSIVRLAGEPPPRETAHLMPYSSRSDFALLKLNQIRGEVVL